jgi:acyl-CoA synthetase (AMP-forming)/AMP-acid ligase II
MKYLQAIHDRKCTDLIGTPTMFSDILNSPVRDKYNISSLSYAVVGGAPVTPSLVRQSQKELDMKISVGYGMTENTCGSFLVLVKL